MSVTPAEIIAFFEDYRQRLMAANRTDYAAISLTVNGSGADSTRAEWNMFDGAFHAAGAATPEKAFTNATRDAAARSADLREKAAKLIAEADAILKNHE